MQAISSAKPEGKAWKLSPDTFEFLKSLGQYINFSRLYGPAHKAARQALDLGYGSLEALLKANRTVHLSVSDEKLIVDGKALEQSNPFVNLLLRRLLERDAPGFSLVRGIDQSEFLKLASLLSGGSGAADNQAFAVAASKLGLAHVRVEKVVYRKMAEDEIVVDREAAAQERDPEPVEAVADPEPMREIDPEPGSEPEAEQPAKPVKVEEIIAFLKGDVEHESGTPPEDLKDLASDPDRLAELMMKAAVVRKYTGEMSGESLADIVVGCLHRTFKGLLEDPAARTKKRKKDLKKSLLLLEKKVLDKLHALGGGYDRDAEETLNRAVEEIVDEMQVESLVTDYVKRKRALDQSEKKILRYMKNQSPEHLESEGLGQRAAEAGLPPEGWRELVVKHESRAAQAGHGKDGGGNVPGDLGVLAVLLGELNNIMTENRQGDTGQVMDRIDSEISQMSRRTGEKIDDLADRMHEEDTPLVGMTDEDRIEARRARESRNELLAEIAQELCQPLSAVNCTVDMILQGHLGKVTEQQNEMLGLAKRCGEQLDDLMRRLRNIVGVPQSLSPDKEALYGGTAGDGG